MKKSNRTFLETRKSISSECMEEDLHLIRTISEYHEELDPYLSQLPSIWHKYRKEEENSKYEFYSRQSFGLSSNLNDELTNEEIKKVKDNLFKRTIDALNDNLFLYSLDLIDGTKKSSALEKTSKQLSFVYDARAWNEGIIQNEYWSRILGFLEYKLKQLKEEIEAKESSLKKINRFLFATKDKEHRFLFDIWMPEYSHPERLENYTNVIENFLLKKGFIRKREKAQTNKSVDTYEWLNFSGKTRNLIFAAFLYVCNERGFIQLHKYTAQELKVIIENTFNFPMKSDIAFQAGQVEAAGNKYGLEFKTMPSIKRQDSLSFFLP